MLRNCLKSLNASEFFEIGQNPRWKLCKSLKILFQKYGLSVTASSEVPEMVTVIPERRITAKAARCHAFFNTEKPFRCLPREIQLPDRQYHARFFLLVTFFSNFWLNQIWRFLVNFESACNYLSRLGWSLIIFKSFYRTRKVVDVQNTINPRLQAGMQPKHLGHWRR